MIVARRPSSTANKIPMIGIQLNRAIQTRGVVIGQISASEFTDAGACLVHRESNSCVSVRRKKPVHAIRYQPVPTTAAEATYALKSRAGSQVL